MNTALIIVDVQIDFLPGGALGVPGSNKILEPIGREIARSEFVVLSRDWHPADHCSFAEQGGIWSVHCVQGTPGAEIHPFIRNRFAPGAGRGKVLNKGCRSNENDSYSAFGASDRVVSLDTLLGMRDIDTLRVCGLTTEYCVKHTVIDALELGYKVELLTDCIAAVNVNPNDGDDAVTEMIRLGAVVRSTL